MSRHINLIVVHCSATRSNQRFTVDMLRACHNARFHGKGIGYHYYIEKDGQIYQTRYYANDLAIHHKWPDNRHPLFALGDWVCLGL